MEKTLKSKICLNQLRHDPVSLEERRTLVLFLKKEGMSVRGIAQEIGRHSSTVQDWAKPTHRTPGQINLSMERIEKHVEDTHTKPGEEETVKRLRNIIDTKKDQIINIHDLIAYFKDYDVKARGEVTYLRSLAYTILRNIYPGEKVKTPPSLTAFTTFLKGYAPPNYDTHQKLMRISVLALDSARRYKNK